MKRGLTGEINLYKEVERGQLGLLRSKVPIGVVGFGRAQTAASSEGSRW